LKILGDLKPIINEGYEQYQEKQARISKRVQKIRKSPPAPPATFKAEQEKQKQVHLQSRWHHQDLQFQNDNEAMNRVNEEPWDLIKQMEAIKFVSGRPQVPEAPIQRTKIEFNYPAVILQPQQLQQQPPIQHIHLNELKEPRKSHESVTSLSPPPKPPPKPPSISVSRGPPTPVATPPPTEPTERQFAIGCTYPTYPLTLYIPSNTPSSSRKWSRPSVGVYPGWSTRPLSRTRPS
jgi:hypothetical protein